jgi:hypothetical protein
MLTMSVDRRKADIAVARAEIMLVAKNQKEAI